MRFIVAGFAALLLAGIFCPNRLSAQTLVQQNQVTHDCGGSNCTTDLAYSSNNVAGTLLVGIATYGNGALTVTDDNNGAWTMAVDWNNGDAMEIWYFCGAAAGANTVHFAITGQFHNSAIILEFSGPSAFVSGCLDQANHANALTVTTPGAVSQSTELVLGVINGNNSTPGTFSAGSGYTAITSIQATSYYNRNTGVESFNTTTGLSGTQTASGSFSGTPANTLSLIATFKLGPPRSTQIGGFVVGPMKGSRRSGTLQPLPYRLPFDRPRKIIELEKI